MGRRIEYAIPPIVRGAILAAEDKRFFSHNGVDYYSLPRVLGKVRVGALPWRLATFGRHDNTSGRAIFAQGKEQPQRNRRPRRQRRRVREASSRRAVPIGTSGLGGTRHNGDAGRSPAARGTSWT